MFQILSTYLNELSQQTVLWYHCTYRKCGTAFAVLPYSGYATSDLKGLAKAN